MRVDVGKPMSTLCAIIVFMQRIDNEVFEELATQPIEENQEEIEKGDAI